MARKKKTEGEKTAGFFMKLGTVMLELARDRDIPVAAIHHLAKPAGRLTLIKMMEILKADWRGSEAVTQMSSDIQKAVAEAQVPKPPADERREPSVIDDAADHFDDTDPSHCIVGDPKELFGDASGAPKPSADEPDDLWDDKCQVGNEGFHAVSFEALLRHYGWVSPKLKGARFRQSLEISPAEYVKFPVEPKLIALEGKSFDLSMGEMQRLNVRPASMAEAHECFKASHGLLKGNRVIVMGSYVMNGDRLFPSFYEEGGKTCVGLCYIEDIEGSDRFLVYPLPKSKS